MRINSKPKSKNRGVTVADAVEIHACFVMVSKKIRDAELAVVEAAKELRDHGNYSKVKLLWATLEYLESLQR
jgi:hypothetical protein